MFTSVRPRWSRLGPALALSLVLLATASSVGPARSAGAQVTPLSFEVTLAALIAFEWPFVAVRDGGLGREQQVNLELTVVDTDARSAQALLGGSVDFAETSIDAIARAAEQGGDLVAIGGIVNRPPYGLAVRQGINSFADLRGRSIAVTDLRGGSTVVLKLLLQSNGLQEGDYDLRPFGGTPNRYAALVNGAVDAAIVGQPADFRAQDEGYPILAYTTARDFQFTVYAIRRSWGEQNHDKVLRFLRTMIGAHRWLSDPANREAAIDLGMRVYRVERSPMERTWDLYFRDYAGQVISPTAEMNMSGVDAVLRVLAADGEIRDPTNVSRYVDDRYRQEALLGN
jgi:ABC-type nitrate/sulfonate/bicarbonate transport system substrate-binding protein